MRRVRRETVVAIVVLGLVSIVFLHVTASNPPGFFRDESANAYNAYTIAKSGRDEFGARLPLFIRSFDDYKSALYVYLLAGVYEVTGLSTEAARAFSAAIGLATVLTLFLLALSITRRRVLAAAFAALVGLSPWLFENSRVAFDLVLTPLLLALFLLTLHRAATGAWRARHSLAIGLLLAAIAYSYQVGRVLAPLLAIGLILCWPRRWRQLALVWGVFLATAAVPILVWTRAHPGALTARYHATTWVHVGQTPWDLAWQFITHYAANMNLWAWASRGGVDLEDHARGAGSLFFVEVALALAGAAIILARRRRDPWWRFVCFGVLVSPVAASFVYETLSNRRMVALPVFLPLLAIPALEWIASARPRKRAAIGGLALAVFAVEAVHWQVVWDRYGPTRIAALEAEAPAVVADAFRHANTVYAFRFDHPQYIDLLLYGAIAGKPRSRTVILENDQRPPVGAVFVSGPRRCPQCPVVDQEYDFVAYRYKPARPAVVRTHFQLNSPLLPVGSPLQFLVQVDNTNREFVDHVQLNVRLPGVLRLSALPFHDRGSCRIDSVRKWYEQGAYSTIRCYIGFLPGSSSTSIRYIVTDERDGPQTMTASISSDQLEVNPVGSTSRFTVDLTPPAYARASTPSRSSPPTG